MLAAKPTVRRLALALAVAVFSGPCPTSAQAAAPDARTLYECEAKAAEYTKNLGKSGDKKLYQEHLQLCLEVAEPAQPTQATAQPRPKSSDCGPGKRPITFVNNNQDTIWVGAYDSKSKSGVPAPPNWPNWELPYKATKTWCAPSDFEGRFTARAGCDVKTGKCQEGDCCSGTSCPNMICTTTSNPASLAEINFDEKTTKLVWYDTSYVDGYNVLVTITPKVDSGSCEAVGTGKLPDCPWPTSNGVCLAPYKQYQVDNPWYAYEQDYYILAAMCAKPDVCGCGNQCTTGTEPKPLCETTANAIHPVTQKAVTLKSSGCSPLAQKKGLYKSDPYAQQQIVCDPLGDDFDNCQHPWPKAYKKYVKQLDDSQPKSYSWQYKDNESLATCQLKQNPVFTVTFGPRPGSPGNRNLIRFSPGANGTVKVGDGPAIDFVQPTPMQLPVVDGTTLVVDRYCDPDKKLHLSCNVSYSKSSGFTNLSGPDCTSGINFAQSKTELSVGVPASSLCKSTNANAVSYSIFSADNTEFYWKHGNQPEVKNSVTDNRFQVSLADKDTMILRAKCISKGFLTCPTTFSMDKKMLTVDPGASENCVKVMADWNQTALQLHPATVADDRCK